MLYIIESYGNNSIHLVVALFDNNKDLGEIDKSQ